MGHAGPGERRGGESAPPARAHSAAQPGAARAPRGPAARRRRLLLPQLRELYTLLNENYVEDDGNMFRFDYSPEFLLWWVLRAAGGARAGGSRCPPVPVSPPPRALTGASFPCLPLTSGLCVPRAGAFSGTAGSECLRTENW